MKNLEKAVAALAIGVATLSVPAAARAQTLTEVTGFGSNPGNIRMFRYVPSNLTQGSPLVVVLHGCGQSASDMDDETGWTKWADQRGFALLFPQQQSSNNGGSCWNFFVETDNDRGEGEPLSVKQQVDWMISQHGLDANQVYVTGLSSGAAMTNVMLAAYPDVFAAGAPIAGVAYRCATSTGESLRCNRGKIKKSPSQWGELVRGATTWNGPWPRVSIWHGDKDGTVNVANLIETTEQWIDVHGIDQTADVSNTVAGYPHKEYRNGAGVSLVETYTLTGFGHATPVDPGNGSTQCGTAVGYAADANICASYHIANWFGI